MQNLTKIERVQRTLMNIGLAVLVSAFIMGAVDYFLLKEKIILYVKIGAFLGVVLTISSIILVVVGSFHDKGNGNK
ncbi:hypothetical protein ACN1T8_002345 [Vibrio cholerae]|uniref:hypothetical protein n=1 Tax=Gammaproteobacteria TaxID=1236 RepID=UPI000847F912|nr:MULTISPECIES: hypothetical protein [Gammaproteobacteria]EGR3960042.1 hypothetical protein [Vibrio cholerae]MBY4643447.1 hypothetical protein [Vibrio cholerae]MCR9658654.1 hypothetical protein [Vibrio cholerae]MCR9689334.1 hypothetical protein [Vibrio cholerae]MCR9738501.1 hypothetical protein [Vibrio cholerae]